MKLKSEICSNNVTAVKTPATKKQNKSNINQSLNCNLILARVLLIVTHTELKGIRLINEIYTRQTVEDKDTPSDTGGYINHFGDVQVI